MLAKIHVKDRLDGNTINLSLADLHEVPVREIASVRKGIILDLSNNHLVNLGRYFSCLTHLVQLDLSKNLLRKLPEDFGDLSSLERLDLYGNKLRHLPRSFSRLRSLKWLDLKGNPLVPRLAQIAGPCEDTKDCEECAENVVRTLSRMVTEMEEERKRRLKDQLSDEEREEHELERKEREADRKRYKFRREKLESGEKSTSLRRSTAKEPLHEKDIKRHRSKERSTEDHQDAKTPQELPEGKVTCRTRDRSTQVRTHFAFSSIDEQDSQGTLFARIFVGLFLFLLLAAVLIVTLALWNPPLFHMLAGPQGRAYAQDILRRLTDVNT